VATAWEEVDERVLRWVLERPSPLEETKMLEFPLSDPQPFAAIEGLDTRQVSDALHRLASADLITGRYDNLGSSADWWHLRVAPLGLKVLGEWPDLERVVSAVGIRELLLRMAEGAEPEEQTTLRRTAGLIGRTSGEIVRQTMATLGSDAAKEALE
jgi:hypothetical protein